MILSENRLPLFRIMLEKRRHCPTDAGWLCLWTFARHSGTERAKVAQALTLAPLFH
jgi:hypothetical protein